MEPLFTRTLTFLSFFIFAQRFWALVVARKSKKQDQSSPSTEEVLPVKVSENMYSNYMTYVWTVSCSSPSYKCVGHSNYFSVHSYTIMIGN